MFDTKYIKTINTYWPYNTTSSDNDSSSHHHKSFPKWAAAVIGVLLGLLVVILAVVGLWFFLRRRQRRYLENEKEREPGPSEADGTERLTTMYGGGPVSPVPGPQSTSTGQETSTGAQTTHTHDSIATSASPATVESGGGIVHEMHGMCLLLLLFSMLLDVMLTLMKILLPSSFRRHSMLHLRIRTIPHTSVLHEDLLRLLYRHRRPILIRLILC